MRWIPLLLTMLPLSSTGDQNAQFVGTNMDTGELANSDVHRLADQAKAELAKIQAS